MAASVSDAGDRLGVYTAARTRRGRMMAKKKAVKENVCGKNRVLAFIKKRFPEDSHWTDGNCWWFAEILCVRFRGEIWYNPVDNHFVTKIGRHWYLKAIPSSARH